MKKNLMIICMILASLFIITGCSTSKSYTYKVETGDNIKIKLDTSDGYDITSEVPFSISKDDEKLSDGTFITLDAYEQYIDVVENDINSKVIDTGSKNGITYTFYSYNDSEYNYIIKIDDSNTAMILGNPISEESAKECFNRLTISNEE